MEYLYSQSGVVLVENEQDLSDMRDDSIKADSNSVTDPAEGGHYEDPLNQIITVGWWNLTGQINCSHVWNNKWSPNQMQSIFAVRIDNVFIHFICTVRDRGTTQGGSPFSRPTWTWQSTQSGRGSHQYGGTICPRWSTEAIIWQPLRLQQSAPKVSCNISERFHSWSVCPKVSFSTCWSWNNEEVKPYSLLRVSPQEDQAEPGRWEIIFSPNQTLVPSLSEIGDLSFITSCLVFLWTLLNIVYWLKYSLSC